MKKAVWNGGTLLGPLPVVLVSVGTLENPNVFTVAWTGIVNTQPPKTYISVRPERFSYDIIKNNGEFVINMPSCDMVKAVDYCGVKSGRNTDKIKDMNLHLVKADSVSVPLIENCPINMECRVSDVIEIGTHTMFMADIIKININEDCIDERGKLHIKRCNLMAFAHGEYFKLGDKIGTFGYSVQKKKKRNNIAT